MPLVKFGWLSLGLALLGVVLLLGSTAVFAQEPPITVTTDSPFPLLVNGLPAEELTTEVLPDDQVCVQEPLSYLNQRERWAFRSWSHGPTTLCVTLTEPGVYRATYDHEFVVHIDSEVGQIRVSNWVVDGTRVEVGVPETVHDGERTRWHFQQWGQGESPFTPINIVAPLEPMDLKPTWTKEYLVEIQGTEDVELEGSGWHEAGSLLALRAPAVVESETEGERLKFAFWRTVGVPVLAISEAGAASTGISVDGPYTLRAEYDKEFLVIAKSPFGVLSSQWVKEGEGLVLEAPPIQETVPGERRLIFQRWVGQEGLTYPKITGVANGPINITAVYEQQFMVSVESPFGASGGGWYSVGAMAPISVPEEGGSTKVIFKRSFKGFVGYPQDRSRIDVAVDKPLAITALYGNKLDWSTLGLILLAALVALVVLVAVWWVMLLVRRTRRYGAPDKGRRLFGRR